MKKARRYAVACNRASAIRHSSRSTRLTNLLRSTSYTVTYSASVWPSDSLQVQLGVCDKSHAECVQHYKENGAMIEAHLSQLIIFIHASLGVLRAAQL